MMLLMRDPNSYVTLGQLEKTLDTAFEVFFVRIEAMVEVKIDLKVDHLAILTQQGFTRVKERLDRIETQLGRHRVRITRLERERGF